MDQIVHNFLKHLFGPFLLQAYFQHFLHSTRKPKRIFLLLLLLVEPIAIDLLDRKSTLSEAAAKENDIEQAEEHEKPLAGKS